VRTVLTLVVGAAIGALIAVGVMLALDDDSPAEANSLTTDGLTSADCVELIPDPVFETLGWQLGGVATENAGRCERYGDDGSTTVGDLAVVASSGEDRAEAAERVYDERCSELFGGGSTPDLDVEWLPDGATACARLLPEGQEQGLAEVVLLTDADEVVQIRLVAIHATAEDAVQDAFAQLVAAADQHW